MRLLLFLLFMLAASVGQSAGIPSSVSGGFNTPDRACRLVFSRGEVVWTFVEIDCLRWGDGAQTSALYRIYTPNQCPTEYNVFAFDPRVAGAEKAQAVPVPGVYYLTGEGWRPFAVDKSATEYFAIRGHDELSGALSTVVGTDPSPVSNGIGVPQTWWREEVVASPAPYSCTHAPTLRFRVFGR